MTLTLTTPSQETSRPGQFPLAARIFAVADVWDALRSDRPYRHSWLEEKMREHIRFLTGTHFDPQVVEVFLLTQEGSKSNFNQ